MSRRTFRCLMCHGAHVDLDPQPLLRPHIFDEDLTGHPVRHADPQRGEEYGQRRRYPHQHNRAGAPGPHGVQEGGGLRWGTGCDNNELTPPYFAHRIQAIRARSTPPPAPTSTTTQASGVDASRRTKQTSARENEPAPEIAVENTGE